MPEAAAAASEPGRDVALPKWNRNTARTPEFAGSAVDRRADVYVCPSWYMYVSGSATTSIMATMIADTTVICTSRGG